MKKTFATLLLTALTVTAFADQKGSAVPLTPPPLTLTDTTAQKLKLSTDTIAKVTAILKTSNDKIAEISADPKPTDLEKVKAIQPILSKEHKDLAEILSADQIAELAKASQ